jgi:hypothetical protein
MLKLRADWTGAAPSVPVRYLDHQKTRGGAPARISSESIMKKLRD